MTKYKYILVIATIFLALAYACDNTSSSINNFDHEAQAVKDKDTIQKFLKSHYFDVVADSIKPIEKGKVALKDDPKLKSATVNEYGIDYTYYYYVSKQGTPKVDKGFPTVTDSILPTYKLRAFSKSNEVKKIEDSKTAKWFDFTKIAARGFSYGFTHFKGGNLKKEAAGKPYNGPITYEDAGKGFFILPSGLAYRNSGSNANKNFIFYVELYDFIKDTDHDNDTIPSSKEDVDNDKNYRNDDTDKDGIINMLDTDDDGDGVLTKNEDANKDGDPRNDFSDPNNPTLPDYLNHRIKKKN